MAEPDDFDVYFQELLEVPWDEYLAFDDKLEADLPPTAPDTKSYTSEENSGENESEPDPDPPPPHS